jgi:hypothetical protein
MTELGAHPLSYFHSAEEANEWLEFDAGDEEVEQASYRESDRFEEWRQWREQERASA